MIIRSISMKNFQCYFGEHERNTFNFKEGLNLVIGDNGGGKSKLYDAFYWIIYDKIFNSDIRRFQPTNSYKEKFISDKAKSQCVVGDYINVEVNLNAKSSADKEYKITRIYRAKKISEREWECDSSSRLLIDENKASRWVSIEEKYHDHILNLVIPQHLKPYMWFQGEQVDGLMDFSDKSTLTNVMNLLSNITLYDDLIGITKKGHETSEKKYRAAQNKLIKDAGKSESLNKELNQIKDYYTLRKFRVTDERRWNAKGQLVTESEANINVIVNNEEIMTIGVGNGPVNALDSALRKALIKFFPTLENLKLSDYKVMILSPEKGTGAITRVFIESVDEKNKHWTTIGVSPNIIDASYNAIYDSITYKLFYDLISQQ